jgi:hypothetical protein
LFPDIFVNFCLQFRWPQWLLVGQSISCSTFSEFLYFNFFSASFCITFLSDGIATSYYYAITLLILFIVCTIWHAEFMMGFIPVANSFVPG